MPKKRETLASLRAEREELNAKLVQLGKELTTAQATPTEVKGNVPQLSPTTVLFEAWQSGKATDEQLDELRDAIVCGGLISEPIVTPDEDADENPLIPTGKDDEVLRGELKSFVEALPNEARILVGKLCSEATATPEEAVVNPDDAVAVTTASIKRFMRPTDGILTMYERVGGCHAIAAMAVGAGL